ncbi:hypothetical protein [Flavobacterium sp. A45]|uniref:hypothetical protein n=1 Tax=Flavobacterium sp. A45 TaxID=1945862 RepID=UPI00098705F2|nr:hypothetical protein [Flavobacterium sp. A45]OOG78325.1 hypothetical protein B0E44_01155 [Flavobacterium sp. A45]
MKLTFICIFLFSVIGVSAQGLRFGDSEYFTLSAFGSPPTSLNEKNLNFGVDIELVSYAKYVRFGVNRFENLEGAYTDFIGSAGLNLTSGYFDKLRYYGGLRLGLIYRTNVYPTGGLECGVDVDLSKDLYIGIKAGYGYRSDLMAISLPTKWEESTSVRVGYAFE